MYYPQKEQERQKKMGMCFCVGTYVHAILCIRVTILNAKKHPCPNTQISRYLQKYLQMMLQSSFTQVNYHRNNETTICGAKY